MKLLVDLALALTFMALVSMRKAYSSVSQVELKRRARSGDKHASVAYRAASYGASLSLLISILAAVTAVFFFYQLARTVNVLWFVLFGGLFITIGMLWMPSTRAGKASWQLALWFAPVWAWLMSWLQPVLRPLASRGSGTTKHSGMYEKQDLLNLLRHQADQADNRIDKDALKMAASALQFGDKLVSDVMLPKRGVKAVSADDHASPMVIDELHKTGHSRFPVYEGKKDNIVGVLFLRDLVDLKKEGLIKNLMHRPVAYVHEDWPLHDVLQASLRTHQQLLVVVNEFEEYVGIITLEDVLEQVIGQPIIDEFDQYEDLRAVIERQAKKEHGEHEQPEPSPVAPKDDKITSDAKTE